MVLSDASTVSQAFSSGQLFTRGSPCLQLSLLSTLLQTRKVSWWMEGYKRLEHSSVIKTNPSVWQTLKGAGSLTDGDMEILKESLEECQRAGLHGFARACMCPGHRWRHSGAHGTAYGLAVTQCEKIQIKHT